MITAFLKCDRIAHGNMAEVVDALRALPEPARASDLLIFDDETGRAIDLDLRPAPPTRGRPSLGVVAREVTLLPQHWDWLAAQRGGASAALRRLVQQAREADNSPSQNYDIAYRFLSAIAGDFPKFEDAVRELYQGNRVGFDHFTHGWPEAIRDHGRALAFPA